MNSEHSLLAKFLLKFRLIALLSPIFFKFLDYVEIFINNSIIFVSRDSTVCAVFNADFKTTRNYLNTIKTFHENECFLFNERFR